MKHTHEPPPPPLFAQARDGKTFDFTRDAKRLGDQHWAVLNLMRDGVWRTLRQISDATGHPEASVSARLRDFRKDRWGGYTVERRNLGGGTWEYRIGGGA